MNLSAMPEPVTETIQMLPLRHLLDLEILTDPVDAEARYNYWLRQGQKNVWLHLVRQASIEDMRQPLTVNIPLQASPGTPLYVLVRVT